MTAVDALLRLMEKNPEVSRVSTTSSQEHNNRLVQLLHTFGIVAAASSSSFPFQEVLDSNGKPWYACFFEKTLKWSRSCLHECMLCSSLTVDSLHLKDSAF